MEALPLWYTFGAQLGMPRHAKKTNTLTTATKKSKPYTAMTLQWHKIWEPYTLILMRHCSPHTSHERIPLEHSDAPSPDPFPDSTICDSGPGMSPIGEILFNSTAKTADRGAWNKNNASEYISDASHGKHYIRDVSHGMCKVLHGLLNDYTPQWLSPKSRSL